MPSTTRYKRGDIVLVPVPKVNVIPSVAEATLDCRLLPGTTRDQWLAASVDTENRQLTETTETLTRARNACSYAGMSNVLDDEKQQQIRALGRLGWTLSRIQHTTGIRRETVSAYLKAAGIPVRGRGCPSESKSKPAISGEVSRIGGNHHGVT